MDANSHEAGGIFDCACTAAPTLLKPERSTNDIKPHRTRIFKLSCDQQFEAKFWSSGTSLEFISIHQTMGTNQRGQPFERPVAEIMAKINVAIPVTYLVESRFSMMGSRDRQKQLWSYRVNLDKRVRSDHPLRKFNELLKLDFVREEVANFYGTKGNVSEDPAVIIKMMVLLFLDNVRSERELMRIIPERLDYMWFLGYGLDDVIPQSQRLEQS
jgi:Transposase domain (DUF772)